VGTTVHRSLPATLAGADPVRHFSPEKFDWVGAQPDTPKGGGPGVGTSMGPARVAGIPGGKFGPSRIAKRRDSECFCGFLPYFWPFLNCF
jgi:hypothetical protein